MRGEAKLSLGSHLWGGPELLQKSMWEGEGGKGERRRSGDKAVCWEGSEQGPGAMRPAGEGGRAKQVAPCSPCKDFLGFAECRGRLWEDLGNKQM